ncbi:MAG: hypothetical protein ACXV5S_03205 [Acidimicrobiales bacterium]
MEGRIGGQDKDLGWRHNLRKLSALAIGIVAISLITLSQPAVGAGGDDNNPTPTPTATTTSGSPEAIVVSSPDGSHHEIHHSGSRYRGHWDCHYYPVGESNSPFQYDIQIWLDPITPEPGQPVGLVCEDELNNMVYSEAFVYDPANPFGPLEAPERAADEARRLLVIAPPNVALSPPATAAQLVGLPTWFWVVDAWQSLQASATLGPVTSTVVATPTSLTFTLDDGTSFSCDGPGTPYDTSRDPADQQSSCTHTFERSGHAVVTATVTYATHWTANTGVGGDLDDLTRTTTVPVTVEEAQAVIH